MVVRTFGEKRPVLGPRSYVDENAVVIGDVALGDEASVWPGAVVRADDGSVRVGRRTALMDLSFAEAPRDKPVVIGEGCIVSHAARLHGCRIGNSCLIGIGAIVLDNAEVGPESIIAAGSLVPPESRIPERSFVMGTPGKVCREVTPAELEWIAKESAVLVAKSAKYASEKSAP